MPELLHPATPADAPAIAALRNATADDLTARHGKGWWSGCCTERGVLFDMKHARVYVVRENGAFVATLRLATKKPWAIDRSYFTPCARPLYLTSMAVAPERQRQGLGKRCLTEAVAITRNWPADGIYLDAFDHDVGAGEFYRKCGFREVGRVKYRGVPLIYLELLVPKSPPRG
jgi:ribosomal protein S18 acetylase RimI-like enzyme